MKKTQKKQQINKEVEVAWKMKEAELYRHLGLASIGNKNMKESTDSMKFLMEIAANTDANSAIKQTNQTLEVNGKNFFKKIWDEIRDIVCQIYSGGAQIGGKDLVTYIIGILTAAGKIINPFLILVITIAVKKGLDMLCSVE